jgi:hypothetical protein
MARPIKPYISGQFRSFALFPSTQSPSAIPHHGFPEQALLRNFISLSINSLALSMPQKPIHMDISGMGSPFNEIRPVLIGIDFNGSGARFQMLTSDSADIDEE